MCMIGYTLLNGSKVFAAAPKGASVSYKLVSMILACTGCVPQYRVIRLYCVGTVYCTVRARRVLREMRV